MFPDCCVEEMPGVVICFGESPKQPLPYHGCRVSSISWIQPQLIANQVRPGRFVGRLEISLQKTVLSHSLTAATPMKVGQPTMSNFRMTRFAVTMTAGLLTVSLMTACSSNNATTVEKPQTDSTTTTQADSVNAQDVWAKAAPEGDMSAMFGRLTNDGDQTVTIVSVSSDEATEMQLHETVMGDDGSMKMQEKGGGFTIEPGATLTLEPGGNHLMYMELTAPLQAGADSTVTLTFSDNSTLDLSGAIREYSGAHEEYVPDHAMDHGDGHDDHEHDHDSDGHTHDH